MKFGTRVTLFVLVIAVLSLGATALSGLVRIFVINPLIPDPYVADIVYGVVLFVGSLALGWYATPPLWNTLKTRRRNSR